MRNIKSNLILFAAICVFLFSTGLPAINAEPRAPLILPMDGDIITGFRQEYIDIEKGRYLRHTGIDIAGSYGQKIAAAGNGIVSYIGFSPIGGRTIVIAHNKKIRTTYLNLENIYVSIGSYIRQGDIIASIGADNDPSSTEIHLHFGIIYDGKYLDPVGLFRIDYKSISRFLYLKRTRPDFILDY